MIFTTAYEHYALKAIKASAIDYLLKPIAFDRFYKAAQKVLQSSGNTNSSAPEVLSVQKNHDFIFVKTEHKIQKIYLDDILYIEGLKDYISIFTRSERIITLQNMKKMEESLPSKSFIRVHKSYIIALGKIESIERSRIQISEKISKPH